MITTAMHPVKYVTPSFYQIKKAELNEFINKIKEKRNLLKKSALE